MEPEYLNCKYLGLHSTRYHSTLLVNNSLIHPLGSYVLIRRIEDLQVQAAHKLHNATIMVILCIPNDKPTHYVSMAYNGEVKLLSSEFEELHCAHSTQSSLRNGCANTRGDLVAACSVLGCYNGIVDVWKIEESKFVHVFKVRGNYKACEFTEEDSLFVIRYTVIDDGGTYNFQRDYFIPEDLACEDFAECDDSHIPNTELISLLQKHSTRTFCHYLCLFSNFQTDLTTKSRLFDLLVRITSFKGNRRGQGVLGTSTRMIFVVQLSSLEFLHSLSITGFGTIMAINFIDNMIYFSPQQYYYCRFDIDQEPVHSEVDYTASYNFLTTAKTDREWVNKTASWIGWAGPSTLIAMNEYGIFKCTLDAFSEVPNTIAETTLEIYKMTCCGLAVHPSGKYVAIGDFTGTLIVWDTLTGAPIYRSQMDCGIRSITWNSTGANLYVGTVSATLHLFKDPLGSPSEPQVLANVTETANCMAWTQGGFSELLALGTNHGELWVFSLSEGFFQSEARFTAHLPDKQNTDPRFGSLNLYSEIWSLAWSPSSNELVATGSEDQSVVIWDWKAERCVQRLCNHNRAVTGVRWARTQEVFGLEEIFVSCSDDMTLRVYSPVSWELLHTFETSLIKEWHTITYCEIEKDGARVACVTQNGFLVIFSLETLTHCFVGRVHNGSIEGLDWRNGTLVTCSAECICCIVSTHNK